MVPLLKYVTHGTSVNFVMKEFPAYKQLTILWMNLDQQDP
jgi:hypothetical protein